MVKITVNDKIYSIVFTYGTIGKTDIVDRLVSNSDTTIREIISNVAELLLYGLQAKHKDEYGFSTDAEKEQMLDKVFTLMDAYEAESTEEEVKNVYDLYQELQEDLMKNGFLSRINQNLQEQLKAQKATKTPQDHKKKS